jgi:hypothetical protein
MPMSPIAIDRGCPRDRPFPASDAPYARGRRGRHRSPPARRPRRLATGARSARIDARARRADRGHRGRVRRPRRHRGAPARVFSDHAGGPRPHGAGRGTAARAGFGAPRTGSSKTSSRAPTSPTARRRSRTAWLVSASAWALGVTARVIHPGESPEGILETLGKRLGLPTVRAATRQAMRLLGSTLRPRPDHRRGAGPGGIGPPLPLFLRHARRGRAYAGRCRALPRLLSRCHRGHRQGGRQRAGCRTGRASRSSSRRCIRATRR